MATTTTQSTNPFRRSGVEPNTTSTTTAAPEVQPQHQPPTYASRPPSPTTRDFARNPPVEYYAPHSDNPFTDASRANYAPSTTSTTATDKTELPNYKTAKYANLYASDEDYLNALRAWAESKKYVYVSPQSMVGFYGTKTLQDFAAEQPTVHLPRRRRKSSTNNNVAGAGPSEEIMTDKQRRKADKQKRLEEEARRERVARGAETSTGQSVPKREIGRRVGEWENPEAPFAPITMVDGRVAQSEFLTEQQRRLDFFASQQGRRRTAPEIHGEVPGYSEIDHAANGANGADGAGDASASASGSGSGEGRRRRSTLSRLFKRGS